MTEIDYAARVARGIALMDQAWPNWAMEIDLDRLDVESGLNCVTAQYAQRNNTSGNWKDGMARLGLRIDSYTEHGFRTDDESRGDYDRLNDLWRSEVERRRAQVQDDTAGPEADG